MSTEEVFRDFNCTCGVAVQERTDPEAEPIIYNIRGSLYHSCQNVLKGKRSGKGAPEYFKPKR